MGFSPSKKFVFIYLNESPLKMMKNAFYFILKANFVLKVFTFLYWLFDCVEKRLEKKAIVVSKFMTLEWTTNNYIAHIAHDFWRKVFLTLYFINWPSFIAWFFLGYMWIVIICCLVSDVSRDVNISRTKRAFNMR